MDKIFVVQYILGNTIKQIEYACKGPLKKYV